MYEFSNLGISILNLLVTILYFKSLLKFKSTTKKTIVSVILIIVCIQASFSFTKGEDLYGYLLSESFTIAILLTLFSGSIRTKIVLGLFTLWIFNFSLSSFYTLKFLHSYGTGALRFAPLVLLIIFTLFMFSLKKGKSIYNDINLFFIQTAIEWFCLFVFSIVFHQINESAAQITFQQGLLLLLLNGLSVLLIMMFNILHSINKKNKEYSSQEQKHDLMESYYSKAERHQKEVTAIKKDMQQQYRIISSYISNENFTEAEEKIKSIIGILTSNENIPFTSNSGINALINVKYNEAVNNKITCDFKVRLPKLLNISSKDLAVLIGNILDNAIEACRYCEGQKFIKLRLALHNNTLVLLCENSTDGQVNLNGTRKLNSENHGLGLKNVKKIVSKYNGSIEIELIYYAFSIEITILDQGVEK